MTLMQDDQTLLIQIANSQPEALSELYDRYGRLVFSLAMHIMGDVTLAEEITQDVFLQIWNKAASYQPGQGRVVTWLSSVAHHRTIDVLRRQGARPEGHRVELEEDSLFNLRGDSAVEPSVEKGQINHQVHLALAGLPPDQQKVVWLAYFDGMTQQEIADKLGEPLGTVKTRMRLGMIKLRQLLVDLRES